MNFSRPEYVFIALVGFLAVLFFLIGRISGWSTLAYFYRFPGEFVGQRWRFQSGQLRWYLGYNNCLTIGASESGLYLSVFFLFRIGHPSLFIPWGDISANTQKSFWGRHMEFRFKQAQMIPLRVSLQLGEKVITASGHSGPGMELGEKRN
ncbi:MAG: hypothetical protein QME83_10965 [Thermodesulfobacteriota bacterium]|nr:hypothetical protein [Thermodesulfobacteriota bacterium]